MENAVYCVIGSYLKDTYIVVIINIKIVIRSET